MRFQIVDMNKSGVVTLVQTCRLCKKDSSIELDAAKFKKWKAEDLKIQGAFPELTADQREQVMSGLHGPCFDKLFEGMEEPEDNSPDESEL